ncbi:hypothetical protein L1987_53706 [Smallanthus sonchifolius]|uniref:Uncharacterized protein n=1 Tax=Smallanthus sonchifolius TaxID=185202 RepID=A0ACB9EWP2_9ASTR|nr:hypothetical protein L1987_53706 [Smallanthus sonchifolius]
MADEGASITSICALSSFYWNGFLRDLAASQALRWLDRGIYVDDENEIDGLKQLLYGRDGRISPESCPRVSGVLRCKDSLQIGLNRRRLREPIVNTGWQHPIRSDFKIVVALMFCGLPNQLSFSVIQFATDNHHFLLQASSICRSGTLSKSFTNYLLYYLT